MPNVLDLTEGAIFAQQFRVIRPLAQGGMGAVYVVEQLSTGKKRALKLMLPSATLVDGSRRFEQEARTSSLIASEHVVDVIAAGVEGAEQVPWLAMELMEGESLESHLLRSGPLSAAQAYEILTQLAHALSAAHDIGVVHRDIKPDNIFLARARNAGSEFMVKVLDFGLATVVAADTKNTTALGSPLWMAPEQAQTDAPITLATDVWALGLLAFRMLTGQIYWTAADGSLHQLLRELLIDPLPPPSQRSKQLGGAELPVGFDEWFEHCVVREKGLRFQHAREAWLSLEPVLEAAGAQLSRRSPFSQPPASEQASLSTLNLGPAASEEGGTQQTPSGDLRAWLGQHPAPLAGLSASAAPVSLPAARKPAQARVWLLLLLLTTCLATGLLLARRLSRERPVVVEPTAPATLSRSAAHADAMPATSSKPEVVQPEVVQPEKSLDASAAVAPTPAVPSNNAKPGRPVQRKPAPPAAPPSPKPHPSLPDLL
ncbi:MAG TPA: protein kinase [Polyangiaceae bacterium]|nr:protein kinase [Polyangiaceae bacterium]